MKTNAILGFCMTCALGVPLWAAGAGVVLAADTPASVPAAAPAASPPATAPAADPKPAAPATGALPAPKNGAIPVEAKSDPVVCKRDAPLGSRLAGKKECMRRSEWAARAKESRDAVDSLQRGATAQGPDKSMGGG